MKVHDPRKAKEFRIVTASGKSVWMMGRKHTLEFEAHRLPAMTLDDTASEWCQKRLKLASIQVGEPCQWVFHRETEVMDVSL